MYNFDTTKLEKQLARDYLEKGISLREVARNLEVSPQGAYSKLLKIIREMHINGEVEFKKDKEEFYE